MKTFQGHQILFSGLGFSYLQSFTCCKQPSNTKRIVSEHYVKSYILLKLELSLYNDNIEFSKFVSRGKGAWKEDIFKRNDSSLHGYTYIDEVEEDSAQVTRRRYTQMPSK